MQFKQVSTVEINKFDLKNTKPLVVANRDVCAVHNDTDSVYFSITELKNRLLESGYHIDNEDEYREFFRHSENIFQTFFDKVLAIRANKSKTTNKINFNRENIFKNMFCFAKKLYIGNIIDSEGAIYPMSKMKHKIMGVPIKKSTMPDFCKVAAEDLAFKICDGMGYNEAQEYIFKIYDQFKHSDLNEISSVIGIKNYTKYTRIAMNSFKEKFEKNLFNAKKDFDLIYNDDIMTYYMKHGLVLPKGLIFAAKASLVYNYIVMKDRLKYNPIRNNSKIRYVYVKPSKVIVAKDIDDKIEPIEAVGYVESWPKEFDKYFEIDYETAFRKSFCALFDSMFKIANWIGPKDCVKLEQPPMFEFFA